MARLLTVLTIGLCIPNVAIAAEGGGSFLSLLAPLVAITLAIVTRKVVPSLLTGAAIGGLVATEGDPVGTLAMIWGFLAGAVFDLDHFKISLFSVLVAAMVGVLLASGAMHGLVDRLRHIADGPRGAMVASWLSGLIVFFDDYANCLVVGNAMGPMCDRVGVSRAKLAYIVDSTAAPIATLAIVSTWVAFQVGEIQVALTEASVATPAFSVFVQSLPYAFYSWFTILFVGTLAYTERDFGPMAEAERQSRERAAAGTAEVALGPAFAAGAAIFMLVFATFAAMFFTGKQALGQGAASAPLFEIIGAASAYDAMLVGSGSGLFVAVVLSVGARALAPEAVPRAALQGVLPVLEALGVLYAAWTLGGAVQASGAADFISGALADQLPAGLLPALTFLLAAAIAFATGTSYGTMLILIPLVLPLAITLTGDVTTPIGLASTAAVLSGAVLGDHISPISDTTILSALGSGVDLITHVRTQLPYALSTGVIALVCGFLPAGYGANPWLLIAIGGVAGLVVVRSLGRTTPAPEPRIAAA